MKRLKPTSKIELLPLFMSLVLLLGFSGLTGDLAFAAGKKKITPDVAFRIEVEKVIGVNDTRTFAKIWFNGVDARGATVDGVGSVFFTPDTDGSPHESASTLVSADVTVNSINGQVLQTAVVGTLSSIVIDGNGGGFIEGRGTCALTALGSALQ